MAQHTPGPWIVDLTHGLIISTPGRRFGDVARVGMNKFLLNFRQVFGVGNGWAKSDRTELNPKRWVAEAMNEGNARLIAAAPTMLRVLQMVREQNGSNPHFPYECMTAVNEAIKEATGE